MFRTDNKIGFRFGREPQAAESGEDRQAALKSAMQASTQRSGLPAPRPLNGETFAPGVPIPQPIEDKMLPTSPLRTEDRTASFTPPPTSTAPTSTAQPVITRARAVIGQVQGDEDARALDGVLRTIDIIAARQMEHERELRLARETTDKATADRIRLQEENQQLRDLLDSLLKTVETERRRRTDAVGRIGDRLKSLSTGLDTEPPRIEAA